ncbi:hypothetical protein SBA3_2440003 [Candidatus Sulfopaludibacter sp. SbA3]|nr:hypothetical protein SBA3_2440003 [Candidatus Sulfopaludibacter sp. SbA3]
MLFSDIVPPVELVTSYCCLSLGWLIESEAEVSAVRPGGGRERGAGPAIAPQDELHAGADT